LLQYLAKYRKSHYILQVVSVFLTLIFPRVVYRRVWGVVGYFTTAS